MLPVLVLTQGVVVMVVGYNNVVTHTDVLCGKRFEFKITVSDTCNLEMVKTMFFNS